jgi:hypothetical protein
MKRFDPCLNGNVQVYPSGVDQQHNLPSRDGTEKNGPPAPPAAVDQSTGRGAEAVVAAVEPQGDIGVE